HLRCRLLGRLRRRRLLRPSRRRLGTLHPRRIVEHLPDVLRPPRDPLIADRRPLTRREHHLTHRHDAPLPRERPPHTRGPHTETIYAFGSEYTSNWSTMKNSGTDPDSSRSITRDTGCVTFCGFQPATTSCAFSAFSSTRSCTHKACSTVSPTE